MCWWRRWWRSSACGLLVVKILEQSSDQACIAWLAERKIDLMIGRFTTEDQRSQFYYEPCPPSRCMWWAGSTTRCAAPPKPVADRGALVVDSVPASTAVRKVSDDLFGGAGLALTAGVVETPSFLFALELMNTTHT